MIKYILFFLFITSSVYATQFGSDVPCPVVGDVGYIRASYYTVDVPNAGAEIGLGMTNMETREALLSNNEHQVYFKSRCEAGNVSHIAWTVTYNKAITVNTSWVSTLNSPDNTGMKEIVSLMVGALTAVAFSIAFSRGF